MGPSRGSHQAPPHFRAYGELSGPYAYGAHRNRPNLHFAESRHDCEIDVRLILRDDLLPIERPRPYA